MMIISGILGVSVDELSYDIPRYRLNWAYIELLRTYDMFDGGDKKRTIRMVDALNQ